MRNKLNHTLHKKLSEYCKHCTLHGAYYFNSSSNKWVHIFWALTIASSLGLCGFLCHMIWEKFIIDPTLTVVETTHYPTEKVAFPAVCVCDTEVVYGSSTNNITEVLRLRGFQNDQIGKFYRSISEVRRKGYEVKADIKKMHSILENLGYNYEKLLDLFKKPCEELLKQCIWRAKSVDCSLMFRSVFTFIGYCCQFDISYFRSRAENNTNFAAGTEINEALDITVNTKKLSEVDHVSKGFLLVYVLNSENNITLLDSAITVTSNTYFDVTINVWVMESSKDVNQLSLSSRKCVLKTDLGIEGTSHQNCVMNLVMQNVSEHCRCLPFKYEYKKLNVDDLSPCSWSQLTCVYEALEKVQGNVRDVVTDNECYPNCNLVQYSTEVKYLNLNNRTGGPSNSRITIHFEDNSCMKYRREVLYTWDQMLANLGGIFGLCLGGSIVSIIEILWLIFDLLYTCFIRCRVKHVSPSASHNKNKIFTVSKNNYIGKQDGKADVSFRRYRFVH